MCLTRNDSSGAGPRNAGHRGVGGAPKARGELSLAMLSRAGAQPSSARLEREDPQDRSPGEIFQGDIQEMGRGVHCDGVRVSRLVPR
jgi:hypothetical protein